MFLKLKQAFRLFQQRFRFGNFAYYYWFFPIQPKKIVVTAHYGRGYGDSPKYIVEALLHQGFDIVWLIQKGQESSLPAGVRPVIYGSRQALRELATAKVWLDNCRQKYSPPKRKKQRYIQTWHSPLRLKKIEKDAENQLPAAYLDRAKRDAKKCDYMLAGSAFSQQMYKKAFWFQGEVLLTGTPRCDVFFQANTVIKQRVTTHFGIPSTTNIALYAPTFRKNETASAYLHTFTGLKQALQTKFSGDWKILIRLHPNVAHLASEFLTDDDVLQATDYPDMQELLVATDLLLTDYSSSMFDMAIAGKKVILYTPDIQEYLATERDLYFDIQALPFPLAKTPSELMQQVHQFDENNYSQRLAAFHASIQQCETGHAASAIATKIKAICH
ncbi:glycerophosphotransferase [Listeria booriae]|uniref:CDP-glycerol glycerophosphotransferase family protein n=1 Tax=Listeria booriae TaxID=1552123 RepID=UPI0016257EDF|nr:CDP-glycerol glycerophosphotransferase family protein [Listeria booriae]MBC1558798.1 glycerophosphotransferase [Listeria booriae]